MKRQSMMRYFIVALLTVVCAVFCLAACKGDTEFNVTWNIDQHAEVKVEGYDTLPAKVKDGDTLTFTVTGKDGYTVDEVLRNGKVNINETDGKYSVKISADTTIDVTTKKEVDKVEVTKKPTKLTYFAGESLDKTGMEVSVSYKTGDSEKLADNQYSVVYPTSNASSFVLGDKAFKVKYQGVESADVELTAPVEVKVTIDPVGGKIDSELLASWAARTDLKGYEQNSETGVISFTYSALTSAFVLPRADQITLEGGTLLGWTEAEAEGNYTQIGTDNKVSLALQASWHMVLVEMKSVSLEVSNGTPYLVMELTTNTSLSAYLYLYEGNAKVGFKGDEINGTPGSTVTLRYDLTGLSSAVLPEGTSHTGAANYTSLWMDIRVNTNINGTELSQSIEYDYSKPIAKIGSMIQAGDWCYRLLMDRRNGVDYIRVYFKHFAYTYDAKVVDVSGKPTLQFTGTLNTGLDEDFATKFANGTVTIPFGSLNVTGKVNADGTWTASADLSELSVGFNEQVGAIAVQSADGSATLNTLVEQDNGTQDRATLDLIGCSTIFDYDPEGSQPRYFANKFTSANGLRYDLGVDWNNLYLKVVDAAHEIKVESVSLVERDGVAYLSVNGTYGSGYTEETAKAALAEYYIDLQNNSQGGGTDTSWDTIEIPEDGKIIETSGGTFSILVSLENAQIGQVVFSHFGDNSTNLTTKNISGGSIVIGETKYRIGIYTGWGSDLVCVWVEEGDTPDPPSFEIDFTTANLVVEGDKVYLTVSGTCANCTEEDFLMDLQNDSDWSYYPAEKEGHPTVEIKSDGSFTVKFDITDAASAEYLAHLYIGGNTNDFEDKGGTFEEVSVTAGGKTYTLKITSMWDRNMLTITIA